MIGNLLIYPPNDILNHIIFSTLKNQMISLSWHDLSFEHEPATYEGIMYGAFTWRVLIKQAKFTITAREQKENKWYGQ